MHDKADKLHTLRRQINSLDRTILATLAKRMSLVRAIGEYKREHKLKPLDKKRKKELKETWIKTGRSMRLPSDFVIGIYERIHKHSISVEKALKKRPPNKPKLQ